MYFYQYFLSTVDGIMRKIARQTTKCCDAPFPLKPVCQPAEPVAEPCYTHCNHDGPSKNFVTSAPPNTPLRLTNSQLERSCM